MSGFFDSAQFIVQEDENNDGECSNRNDEDLLDFDSDLEDAQLYILAFQWTDSF